MVFMCELNIDLYQTGKILRDVRKNKGLTLTDLADDNISAGTISRAERGIRIDHEKFIYLCTLLDINVSELPKIIDKEITEEEKETADNQIKLLSIESTLKVHENPREILEQLEQLNIPPDHPLYIYIPYYKGEYHIGRGNFERAHNFFTDVIKIADSSDNEDVRLSNLCAASFCELGKIAYYGDDLELALEYTNKGLATFVEEGLRRQTKYVLLVNKVVYLEQLDRPQEASDTLNMLLQEKEKIRNIGVLLNAYDLKTKLLRRVGMYRSAIEYARKGIYYARLNKKFNHAADLWTSLGEVYVEMNDLRNAELCFLTALRFEPKSTKKYIFFRLYHRLGLLYLRRGQLIKAQKHFEKALQRITTTTPIVRHIEILKSLGDCLFKQHLYMDAKTKYEEALQLALKHKIGAYTRDLQLQIAASWRIIDKKEFYRYLDKLFSEGGLLNE